MSYVFIFNYLTCLLVVISDESPNSERFVGFGDRKSVKGEVGLTPLQEVLRGTDPSPRNW
jgi:hypothetical protein